MNIRKIDTGIGKVPTWGDDDFNECVHQNFVSLKEIVPQINNSIDDINVVVDNLNSQFGAVDDSVEVVTQLKIDTLAAKDEANLAKDAAIAAKNLAETIYDNFDDRYLGTHATEPTVDNDGNALRDGALYYRNSKIYVYDLLSAKWVDMMYIPTLLSSLSDIMFSSKANNDVIQYDSTLGKWVNRSFYSKAELENYLSKLNGIADNANNYVHPLTHDASMITESPSKRFVSDTEKATWNGKIGSIPSLDLGTNLITIASGVQCSIPIINYATFTGLQIKCTLITDTDYIPISASIVNNNIVFTATASNIKYLLVEHSASNFSTTGTKSYGATSYKSYRYYRLRNMQGGNASPMVPELKFFTGTNGTGTKYPSNMTSANTPSPFVVTSSYEYSTTYSGWKAFDAANLGWWAIGASSMPSQWLQVDMGTAVTILSLSYTSSAGATTYAPDTFDVVASNTSAFAGEEIKLGTFSVVGLAADTTKIFNI